MKYLSLQIELKEVPLSPTLPGCTSLSAIHTCKLNHPKAFLKTAPAPLHAAVAGEAEALARPPRAVPLPLAAWAVERLLSVALLRPL